ncbi:hypothetical protein [Leucobacter luti]|uniref:Uncharacterized protein n=1 Tax=Leucobacter luti TaxID=340320 RepID=A0A4V6MD46_9MICO|nr:hypothetical protein [Leucobacter luti]RZT66799.1 hypothetical protein EV139_0926 [Leucobacter luti]
MNNDSCSPEFCGDRVPLGEEHREAADEFLSPDANISPTHTMADLFELAMVQDHATATELLDGFE